MLLLLSLFTAVPWMDAVAPEEYRYSVWTSAEHGRCSYQITDAIETAGQLAETLRGYEVAAGLEILTDVDTPRRCVREAERAARRAGFTQVRVRLGTEQDRVPSPW